MTKFASLLTLTLLYPGVAAAQLPGVIDQNIKSATKAAGAYDEKARTAGKLWIHVRSEAQRREVEGKLGWFRGLAVEGAAFDVRPIQQVANGPQRSELRVFSPSDLGKARALHAQLAKAVPGLVVNDLSAQYRQAKWIEPGHFELWLAPGVTRLATP